MGLLLRKADERRVFEIYRRRQAGILPTPEERAFLMHVLGHVIEGDIEGNPQTGEHGE